MAFGIADITNHKAAQMVALQMGISEASGKALARAEVPGALETMTQAGSKDGAELFGGEAMFRGRKMRLLIVLEPATQGV